MHLGFPLHEYLALTYASQSKDHWIKYFKENPKYPRIGIVINKLISPYSPIPGPCGQEEPLRPIAGPNPNPSLNEDASTVQKPNKGEL